MQQPRKIIPVIYSATYLEPALFVVGLVCYFITCFWKIFFKNQNPWKSTEPYSLNVTFKWMWKKKIFTKNSSSINKFQIIRESM